VLSHANSYSGVVVFHHAGAGLRLLATRHEPHQTIPWHAHDQGYLTIVTRGGYREDVRGRSSELGAGTVVLHPAGERHQDRFGAVASELVNFEASRDALGRLGLAASLLDRRGELGAQTAERLQRLVTAELLHPDSLTPLVLEAALLDVAADTLGVGPAPPRAAPRWLRALDRLLPQRFAEPWSLPALAREVGVHPQHLNRAFRRHRGISIGARLRELRLEQAASLLASSLPLAEVALLTGFYDQSHLTRCFARRYGMPPGAYRSAVARRPRPS
jgi:AraC family transcriptional regulator